MQIVNGNHGIYRDKMHGGEYPSHGYAILMLTMRAMSIDTHEHRISRELLTDGFALMGLRVYETLVGFKYLRTRAFVDPFRIGLIGHSGGSSTGNMTIRIERRFTAFVSDHNVDYSEWGNLWDMYHCETIPRIYPYHLLINDFSTSPIPIKAVPYGYANGMGEIFDFFDAHLKF